MTFNSYTFIIFLVIVLCLFYLPVNWTWRKGILLVASYLFYAAWNPPFVILLWISTIIDWIAARQIDRSSSPVNRRLYLIVSLGCNLGMLGFFKYGAFLLDNMVSMLSLIHIQYQPPSMSIILPVGISFYTFQTMSYTIDVYRGAIRPARTFLDYALYVTFFPQLVAGPIVRSDDFLPQCIQPKSFNASKLAWGLGVIVVGLFEKVVIADGFMAPVVEDVFNAEGIPNGLAAWCGTFAFSVQIFCDFAGYSLCAIGSALCLGFDLPDNFRFPYAALGFSDFWGRWHISLSSWLRDYLYIPLGGNRHGSWATYRNLMLTMLLGGLWHGASWTFMVWGGLHGLYLTVERWLSGVLKHRQHFSWRGLSFGYRVFTFLLVCVAWVFFRSETFSQAFSLLRSMLTMQRQGWTLDGIKMLTVITITCLVVSVHHVMKDTTIEHVVGCMPWWTRGLLLGGMLVGIVCLAGEDRAFIYFQF